MRLLNKILFAVILVGFSNAALATEDLFLPPRETIGRISPDGKFLAVVVNDNDYQTLETIDLENVQRTRIFSTESLNAEQSAISALEWVDDDTLIISVIEMVEGIAKLSDTRNRKHLLVIDASDGPSLIRFVESGGTLISALPQEADVVLFARSGRTSIVYRVDTTHLHEWGKPIGKTARVDGGQFSRKNRVAEVEGLVLRWITSASGSVRAALRWREEEGIELLLRDDDGTEWEVEYAWPKENKKKKRRRSRDDENSEPVPVYIPISLIENTHDFIVRSDDDSGVNSVYRYNYSTQKKTLIYQHPTAEIVTVGLDYQNAAVLYVSYFEDGVVKYFYEDGAYREVADQLTGIYPQYSASIVATDADQNRFLVYMDSPTQPGRAFVVDQSSKWVKELFSVMPWIDEASMASSVAEKVDSQGLEIEYFLTVPDAPDPVPLLVYPHGGPWGVSDSRHFNSVVQYFASRGMAVLQVNYRGSSGYGEEFLEQGKGEFGKRMLDDIEAAMNVVLERSSIDSSRVCAIGESYGGYAAFMLAIRSPERFVCLASFAGVTDLGLLFGSYREKDADVFSALFSSDDLTPDESYEQLRDLSPVFNAGRLQVPVFLAHGKDDTRVDIEHSYRMLSRMRQLEKNVTWHEFPDQGHSFRSPESASDYYEMLGDFLEEQLH